LKIESKGVIQIKFARRALREKSVVMTKGRRQPGFHLLDRLDVLYRPDKIPSLLPKREVFFTEIIAEKLSEQRKLSSIV
jgi:hypothetical protein